MTNNPLIKNEIKTNLPRYVNSFKEENIDIFKENIINPKLPDIGNELTLYRNFSEKLKKLKNLVKDNNEMSYINSENNLQIKDVCEDKLNDISLKSDDEIVSIKESVTQFENNILDKYDNRIENLFKEANLTVDDRIEQIDKIITSPIVDIKFNVLKNITEFEFTIKNSFDLWISYETIIKEIFSFENSLLIPNFLNTLNVFLVNVTVSEVTGEIMPDPSILESAKNGIKILSFFENTNLTVEEFSFVLKNIFFSIFDQITYHVDSVVKLKFNFSDHLRPSMEHSNLFNYVENKFFKKLNSIATGISFDKVYEYIDISEKKIIHALISRPEDLLFVFNKIFEYTTKSLLPNINDFEYSTIAVYTELNQNFIDNFSQFSINCSLNDVAFDKKILVQNIKTVNQTYRSVLQELYKEVSNYPIYFISTIPVVTFSYLVKPINLDREFFNRLKLYIKNNSNTAVHITIEEKTFNTLLSLSYSITTKEGLAYFAHNLIGKKSRLGSFLKENTNNRISFTLFASDETKSQKKLVHKEELNTKEEEIKKVVRQSFYKLVKGSLPINLHLTVLQLPEKKQKFNP